MVEIALKKIFEQIKQEFGKSRGQCQLISIKVIDLAEQYGLEMRLQSGKCTLIRNGVSNTVDHMWNILIADDKEVIIDMGVHYQSDWTIYSDTYLWVPLEQVTSYGNFNFVETSNSDDVRIRYSWNKLAKSKR